MIIAIVANINRTAALVSTLIFNALVQDCDGVLSIPETVHGLRQVQSHLGRWIILGKATLMNYHWSTQCPIQRWIFTMNTPICISTHIYIYIFIQYVYICIWKELLYIFSSLAIFGIGFFSTQLDPFWGVEFPAPLVNSINGSLVGGFVWEVLGSCGRGSGYQYISVINVCRCRMTIEDGLLIWKKKPDKPWFVHRT